MKFQKGHKINVGKIAWNKGLTKETNENVKNYGLKRKGQKHSEEARRKISETRKRLFSEKKLINHLSGKKMSEEQKKKISLSHFGKKHTKETKKKMSEKSLGFLGNHTEEAKRKISISNKIRWNKSEWREFARQRRKNQIIPVKDTLIETKIQDFLNLLNIPFLKHQYMEIEHSYQCDILIPSMNLVIECDGDYWHGNPKIYSNPTEFQIKQIKEDKIRTKELIDSGFRVLRFWEEDIKKMQLNEFKGIICYKN